MQPDRQAIPLWNLIVWLIAVHVAPVFFFFPEFTNPAQRAGWMAILVSTAPVAAAAGLAFALWRRNPGLTLAQAVHADLGRIFGGVISASFAAFFFLAASVCLWELKETLISASLNRTPSIALTASMAFVVVIAIRSGIETIARTAIVLVVGGAIAVGLITAIVLPDADVRHLLPLFDADLAAFGKATLFHASLGDFAPLILFLLPYASVRSPEKAASIVMAPVIGNALIASAFVLTVAVLTYPIAESVVYEYLKVVRYAALGAFAERLDPLLLAGWTVLGYLRIAAFFAGALLALQPVVGLRDYRTLSLPGAIVLVAATQLIFDDNRSLQAFVQGSVVPWNLAFMFLLPAALLVIGWIRQRRG